MTEFSVDERIAALDTAIKRAGGIVRFTAAMNVKHQSVYGWRQRGWVPPGRALAIEVLYSIPREKLMHPTLVRLMNTPSSIDPFDIV